MSKNIISYDNYVEENSEHCVAELICLKCLNRGVHAWMEETPLKDLECSCGEIGFLIYTGQLIGDKSE